MMSEETQVSQSYIKIFGGWVSGSVGVGVGVGGVHNVRVGGTSLVIRDHYTTVLVLHVHDHKLTQRGSSS